MHLLPALAPPALASPKGRHRSASARLSRFLGARRACASTRGTSEQEEASRLAVFRPAGGFSAGNGSSAYPKPLGPLKRPPSALKGQLSCWGVSSAGRGNSGVPSREPCSPSQPPSPPPPGAPVVGGPLTIERAARGGARAAKPSSPSGSQPASEGKGEGEKRGVTGRFGREGGTAAKEGDVEPSGAHMMREF